MQPSGWPEPQRGRRSRKEARVCSTDQREKAARAQGLADKSAFDPAPPPSPPPPPPLRRHQARRRRKRSPNTRTSQTSKECPRNRSRKCSRTPKNISAPTQGPAPVQDINKQTQIKSHGVKKPVFLPFSVSVAGQVV